MESEYPPQSGGRQPEGRPSDQAAPGQPAHSAQGQPAPAPQGHPQPVAGGAEQPGQVAWQRPQDAPAAASPAQPWQPITPGTPPSAAGYSSVPVWHSADPTAPHPATVAPQHTGRRPGRAARWLAAAAAGLVLVAGAGVAGGVAVHEFDGHTSTTATTATAIAAKATNGTVTVADLVTAVKPSVVTIAAQSRGGTSEGSGVVVRSDGYIVTNYHVISGATGSIQVTFNDGSTAQATVVAGDQTGDLALLKVTGKTGLTAVSLGDSSTLAVGDDVIAIGNPLGLGISVSEGIVSALNRQVNIGADESQGRGTSSSSGSTVSYSGAIQTDAAVNEGNSGGALVNASGQLIGITSAIATDGTSTGNVGVAFAIPSSQVQAFLTKSLS